MCIEYSTDARLEKTRKDAAKLMTGETDDTVASPGDEKASLEHLSLRPETANAWQTQGKPKPPPKEEGGEGGDANDSKWKEEDDRDFQVVTNKRTSMDHSREKKREYNEPRGGGGGSAGMGKGVSERNSIPGMRYVNLSRGQPSFRDWALWRRRSGQSRCRSGTQNAGLLWTAKKAV